MKTRRKTPYPTFLLPPHRPSRTSFLVPVAVVLPAAGVGARGVDPAAVLEPLEPDARVVGVPLGAADDVPL